MTTVDLKSLSARQLLEIYNEAATRLGKKPVARFSDAKSALRRVTDILDEANKAGVGGDEASPIVAPAGGKKAKLSPKPKAKKLNVVAEDKPSKNDSVQLYPAYDPNPRRFNSHGFKSYEIVRKNPGITPRDYLKAGGRSNDLLWDLRNGYISLTKVAVTRKG